MQLQMAITYGRKVLIENISEDIPNVLEALLSRAIVKKSATYYVNVGSD